MFDWIFDRNKDGVLDDEEFKHLVRFNFQTSLPPGRTDDIWLVDIDRDMLSILKKGMFGVDRKTDWPEDGAISKARERERG